MAKQTEQREISRGICRFCQGEFAKNKMTQHLKSCKARTAREQDGQGQRLFHLLVEGRYRPEYWMHLEVPAVATLGDLDSFLRTTWLECCDHLSEFEIDGVSYSSYPDDGWGMGFGGLSLVGEEEDEEEEDEEEDEALPDMQEIAMEMSKQLSAEFHADLKDVPVEKIEERLVQLFAENMPPGMSAATMPALRPLLGYMAQSLQQGTLAQDLTEVVMEDEEEEGGMDAELGDVLAVGEKFSYTYDFGSSSTLSLRVIAEREGTLPSDLDEAGEGEDEEFEDSEEDEVDIVVMARNEPPALVCHVCGQPASSVPSGSEYDALAEIVLCEIHANATEYPDELLPLVNSPRTGVCGYTGDEEDWEDEEWEEEDEEE
jgi:hypothetical protein